MSKKVDNDREKGINNVTSNIRVLRGKEKHMKMGQEVVKC